MFSCKVKPVRKQNADTDNEWTNKWKYNVQIHSQNYTIT